MRNAALFLFASLVIGSTARADCPEQPEGTNGHRNGQVTFRIADYADPEATLARVAAMYPQSAIVGLVPSRDIYTLLLPDSRIDCDTVAELIEGLVRPESGPIDPNRPLEYAELNFESEAAEGSTGSIYVGMRVNVGRAGYASQAGLSALGAQAAQANSTGRGVVVAVLDTGVDRTHPELQGAVLTGYDFVSMSSNVVDVGDGNDSDGDGLTDEMVGHGTFIAGLIHSIAPDAKIVPVRVLDSDGFGDAATIAQGIYFAIDRGVEVINISLGSTSESTVIKEAIYEARHKGIVVATAAGNDGSSSRRRYPAAMGEAMGVAALDANGVRANYSNYNSDIFISAPGGDMTGADANNPQGAIAGIVPNGEYASWAGTSLSSAMVAGAAALVRAQHPEWSPDSDTADSVEQKLRTTADDITAQNPAIATKLGAGRVNIGAAVLSGPVAPPPGDFNADGVVDLSDLARLLTDYGAVHSSADLNGSGSVDLSDLAMLLSVFGT
ncbi:MAG: S8 family serine peptidase [Phycisphaerales bacterium]|nr:S8 family serine peptidase [Phycisphaerales bacterium]